MMIDDLRLIDSRELSQLLHVSIKTLMNYKGNVVGAVRVGRHWRYDLVKIRKAIERGENILKPEGNK